MVSDTWFSEIESTILTYLEYMLVEKEDAPFPELNCTTSSENDSVEGVANFPTLYVHLLPPAETGMDLWNGEVNAINATFELQVFTNTSETDCRKIITKCLQEMKKLHFNVNLFPDPQTANKKYFAIARVNRIIASGDGEIVPTIDNN